MVPPRFALTHDYLMAISRLSHGYLTALSRLSHGHLTAIFRLSPAAPPPSARDRRDRCFYRKRRHHCRHRARSYDGAGNVRSDCTFRYAVEAGNNHEHYQKVVNYWSSAKCEKCNAATLEALGTAPLVGGCALDLGCVATVGT